MQVTYLRLENTDVAVSIDHGDHLDMLILARERGINLLMYRTVDGEAADLERADMKSLGAITKEQFMEEYNKHKLNLHDILSPIMMPNLTQEVKITI